MRQLRISKPQHPACSRPEPPPDARDPGIARAKRAGPPCQPVPGPAAAHPSPTKSPLRTQKNCRCPANPHGRRPQEVPARDGPRRGPAVLATSIGAARARILRLLGEPQPTIGIAQRLRITPPLSPS